MNRYEMRKSLNDIVPAAAAQFKEESPYLKSLVVIYNKLTRELMITKEGSYSKDYATAVMIITKRNLLQGFTAKEWDVFVENVACSLASHGLFGDSRESYSVDNQEGLFDEV